MATSREQLARLSLSNPPGPLPQVPRLPESLKKRLGSDLRAELDAYDQQWQTLFEELKKQGSLR